MKTRDAEGTLIVKNPSLKENIEENYINYNFLYIYISTINIPRTAQLWSVHCQSQSQVWQNNAGSCLNLMSSCSPINYKINVSNLRLLHSDIRSPDCIQFPMIDWKVVWFSDRLPPLEDRLIILPQIGCVSDNQTIFLLFTLFWSDNRFSSDLIRAPEVWDRRDRRSRTKSRLVGQIMLDKKDLIGHIVNIKDIWPYKRDT